MNAWILACAFTMFGLCGAQAWQAIYVDALHQADADTKTWNTVSFLETGLSGFLKETNGAATPVRVEVKVCAVKQGTVNPTNTIATKVLTGAAAEFNAARSRDNAQIQMVRNAETGNGYNVLLAVVTGLQPDVTYAFTFVGSRANTDGKNSTTRYAASGRTSGYADLNTYNNETNVARVTGIAPNPDGSVSLAFTGTSANSLGNFHLLAFKIERTTQKAAYYIDAYGAPVVATPVKWNRTFFSTVNSVYNLTNSLAEPGGLTLKITDHFPTPASGVSSLELVGEAAEFNAARGNTQYQVIGSVNKPTASALISGLDPAWPCDFTFTGSRADQPGDSYTADIVMDTLYRVEGFNTGFAILNIRTNNNRVANVQGIYPDADGNVVLRFSKADSNNDNGATPSKFALLALKMETGVDPSVFPVIVSSAPGGSVTVGGGTNDVAAGGSLAVQAVPDEGYVFAGWGGDIADNTSDNPLTFSPIKRSNLVAVFASAASGTASTLYVDAAGRAEDGGDISWNAVDFTNGAVTVKNLVADNGEATAVAIEVVEPFMQVTAVAATAPLTGAAAAFEPARLGTVARGQCFNSSLGVSTYAYAPRVSARVTGLLPRKRYDFAFTGSRIPNTSLTSYKTLYRVLGANSRSASLEIQGNTNGVATASGVVPSEDGSVTVECLPAADNTSTMYYLMAFKIVGETEKRSPRILWFGSTCTCRGDVPEKVADLAELAGLARPYNHSQIEDGATIARHIELLGADAYNGFGHLTGTGTWDHVVIQGNAYEACQASSSVSPAEAFVPDVLNLASLVGSDVSGSRANFVLWQTWPISPEDTAFYPASMASAAVMETETRSNYVAARNLLRASPGVTSARLARVGEAFGELAFTAALYDSDRLNASPLGQALSAMVLFSEIYGISMKDSGVTWQAAYASGWTTADETEWNAMVAAADRVIRLGGSMIRIH